LNPEWALILRKYLLSYNEDQLAYYKRFRIYLPFLWLLQCCNFISLWRKCLQLCSISILILNNLLILYELHYVVHIFVINTFRAFIVPLIIKIKFKEKSLSTEIQNCVNAAITELANLFCFLGAFKELQKKIWLKYYFLDT